MSDDLSKKLDEAREREEYYRAVFLFWKRRRQKLEAQIPDPIWDEISKICDEAWNDEESNG